MHVKNVIEKICAIQEKTMSEQIEGKIEAKASYNIDALFSDSHKAKSGQNILCSIWSKTEVGKTYLALDFPGPIKMVNLDYGLIENLKFYPDKEITDMKCTSFLDAKIKEDDYKWDKVNPINSLKLFEAGLATLIENVHEGTVIIDSMTTINDWLKALLDYKTEAIGHQKDGKIPIFDWKWVTQKWKWLWQLIKTIDANVVVLFRAMDEYENFKKTGVSIPDYRDGTKYEVSVEIKLEKEVTQDGTGKVQSRRIASFNKFRGVNLSENYKVEDLTYEKLMEILSKEGKV